MDDVVAVFRSDLFDGSVALVSGASSGIGLALARGFARCGATVIATGSSADKLATASADPRSAGIRFERLDVRDADAVTRFIDALPRLDILVNAQGVARPRDEFRADVFDHVLDVNLTSAMRLATAARTKLAAVGGTVLNIASMQSYAAEPETPAYAASKTGILGLTRGLAHAWGRDGIRVNAIAPGYHRTDMTRPLWSDDHSHEVIARHAALKRWGTVDDLVGAALFLCSPAAGFITGTDLRVDGGFSVGSTID